MKSIFVYYAITITITSGYPKLMILMILMIIDVNGYYTQLVLGGQLTSCYTHLAFIDNLDSVHTISFNLLLLLLPITIMRYAYIIYFTITITCITIITMIIMLYFRKNFGYYL